MPERRNESSVAWNPGEHDAECEIENGSVGFDGIACLCADRRKESVEGAGVAVDGARSAQPTRPTWLRQHWIGLAGSMLLLYGLSATVIWMVAHV